MYYWYFKLFNNIKSKHETSELARLELESLFGKVEPVYNFFDKLKEEPLSKFTCPDIRIQDFIVHELAYGRIHGYFGFSNNLTILSRLVRRLAYTREIYLIVNSNESPEHLVKGIFPEGLLRKNFDFFKIEHFLCFRFITHQYFLEKSEYISKLSRNEKELKRNVEILFSHLMENIYRIPASSTLSIGKRLQDYFAIREEPSLYLTHYFHPYKGKFHPKMVRALLNYIYPHDEGKVLDNFAGSGTLLVEACLMGLNSIGVEINPLSVLMSNVKCNSLLLDIEKLKTEIFHYFEKVKEAITIHTDAKKGQLSFPQRIDLDFGEIEKKFINVSSELKNYLKDRNEVISEVLICKELLREVRNKDMKNFLLLALSGTISDVARRTKEPFLNVFEGRVNDLYLRLILFRELNKVLKIKLGNSKTDEGDTRSMEFIEPESIDGIVNSPPYSVALDYIKNDYPQLVLLELTRSIQDLEMNMMGSPRVSYEKRGLSEKIGVEPTALMGSKTANKIVKYLVSNGRIQAGLRSFKFFIDMNDALKEMYRIMKKGSKCAIVIGNNHFMVGSRYVEVPNDKVILELAEKIGFTLDKFIGRELQKSSEGIIKEESILILKKEGGSIKMKKGKQLIEEPEIRISGSIGRFEIVKEIVNAFIEFEGNKKGKGVKFRYSVEDLSNGKKLYIHRPGVKWNFDFKVEIPTTCGLEEGRHEQIALLLRKIKNQNEKEFDELWAMTSDLYHCVNNDVDSMLKKTPITHEKDPKVDILLKVVKWLFIMEDIIYWHYEGRAFLYNFFVYVINEKDEDRLKSTLAGIRKRRVTPEKIKSLLKRCGLEWEIP